MSNLALELQMQYSRHHMRRERPLEGQLRRRSRNCASIPPEVLQERFASRTVSWSFRSKLLPPRALCSSSWLTHGRIRQPREMLAALHRVRAQDSVQAITLHVTLAMRDLRTSSMRKCVRQESSVWDRRLDSSTGKSVHTSSLDRHRD